ncbi:MAG: hypothetical protein LBH19_16045 [Dysgonamonadaceae bacterium]|jgi:hypothetical protein|nr:hypothetical protein [Dysgonamonadaceae bacterium]
MTIQKISTLILACLLVLVGCNSNDAARKQLEQARNLYENAQYGSARQSLNELKTQYPKDFDLQKDVLHLMRKTELKEQERNLAFCDSLLPLRQAEVDSMNSFFTFEKTEYDSEGRYTDTSWNPSIESGFSGIKTSVTEANDLVLTAIYRSASPIRYNRLKVSIPSGEYAETQSIAFDGGANYIFKDGSGSAYEIVTFQKGRDNGVISFIYTYSKEKITMEYTGGKKVPTRLLSQKEKDTLVGTVNFATLLKETERIKEQKEKAEKRIQYLQSKL